MPKAKRKERIEIRLSKADKQCILDAAELRGLAITDLILEQVLPVARQILAQEQQIKLQAEAWNGFIALLSTPKNASETLKAAMKEYRKIQEV